MNDLIERLEAMGRRGGLIALGLALGSVLLAAALVAVSFAISGRWTLGAFRFAAVLVTAGGFVLGMIGLRLLTQRHYPSAAEVFPPLSPTGFRDAVFRRDEPVCACTRCRVVIASAFSTGACPVCSSSVDYYEVDSDDDAEMVVLAIGSA